MKNSKGFIIPIIILVIAVATLGGGYYYAKKIGYITDNRPSDILPPPLVGGDKDEHGCVGSAGYSWCEVKQKCLRDWEEKCEVGTDETENWKTYRNEEYGFEFKYPSSLPMPEFIFGTSALSFHYEQGSSHIYIITNKREQALTQEKWNELANCDGYLCGPKVSDVLIDIWYKHKNILQNNNFEVHGTNCYLNYDYISKDNRYGDCSKKKIGELTFLIYREPLYNYKTNDVAVRYVVYNNDTRYEILGEAIENDYDIGNFEKFGLNNDVLKKMLNSFKFIN